VSEVLGICFFLLDYGIEVLIFSLDISVINPLPVLALKKFENTNDLS